MENKKLQKTMQGYYGGLQFEYFAIFNALVSYTSVFLLPQGFTSSEVGLLLAVANLVAVFMQPFFADYADHTERFTIDQLLSLGTIGIMILCSSILVLRGRSIALAIFYVLTISLHTAVQPFLYELNFRLERIGIHMNFGLARSMGSIGFAIMSVLLGMAVENWGIISIPVAAELMMAVMLLNIFLLRRRYFAHADKSVVKHKEENQVKISLSEFIKGHHSLLILNIGVMLLIFHNALYGGFMLQIMEHVGGNSETMGKALSLMALLEVPGMVLFDRLKRRYGSSLMLQISCAGFMLKNVMFLLADSVPTLYAAQFAQMFGFAFFMPAMVSFIHEHTKKGEAVKGQALFTTMFTAGGIFGNLFGGFLIDNFGVTNTMWICLFVSLAGATIIVSMVQKMKHEEVIAE